MAAPGSDESLLQSDQHHDHPALGEEQGEESGPGFWGATSQTVKIIVGTGVIAIPAAVKSSGWLIAAIGLPVIGWLSAYSMKTLIHASQVPSRKPGEQSLVLSSRCTPSCCARHNVLLLSHCSR